MLREYGEEERRLDRDMPSLSGKHDIYFVYLILFKLKIKKKHRKIDRQERRTNIINLHQRINRSIKNTDFGTFLSQKKKGESFFLSYETY